LGIRQARYFGRTKTLFQVCLAGAVANLTLLATASDTMSIALLYTVHLLILAIATSFCVAFVTSLVAAAVAPSILNARRMCPTVPYFQPLQAGSRPAF
jgi:hypothetical protein